MVKSTSNIGEFLWTKDQCRDSILMLSKPGHKSSLNFDASEAYALAENSNFLKGRIRRTCGELFPTGYLNSASSSSTEDVLLFGRAGCDAQVLAFAFYASVMRAVDRSATVGTPLAKYVEALFRLKWSFAQFCHFMEAADMSHMPGRG